jgi:hypothetical protein
MYLEELISEDRPHKLIKILKRINRYIENSVKSNSPVDAGNISISSSGAASFSLTNFFSNLMLKGNPIVVFNEKIYNSTAHSDSLNQLSKILKLPVTHVRNYFQLKAMQDRLSVLHQQ